MNETYTIIVRQKGKEDMVRTGIDKLNSIIIPVELKLAYPTAFKENKIKVEVVKE